MKLLALDTSTEFLSLALQVGKRLFTHDEQAGSAASQRILPQIHQLLSQANIRLADLDGIAFGAGPGAFTGVRIACGVAQGLAFGTNLPVVGVNTLLAIAQASGENNVIVCQDARMGEVYHAAFRHENAAWQEISATGVFKPEHVPPLTGNDWIGAGSGWTVFNNELTQQYHQNLLRTLPTVIPRATAVLQLAQPIFQAGNALTAEQAAPIYIRNRVALTSAQRAEGQRL